MSYKNCNGKLKALALMFVFLCVSTRFCQAQVTFSRDWNAGKRNQLMDNPELHASLKSASAVCHLLVNQIRQLANCESRMDDVDVGPTQLFNGRR